MSPATFVNKSNKVLTFVECLRNISTTSTQSIKIWFSEQLALHGQNDYSQDYLFLVILCKNTYMTRDPCQNDMLTDFTNLNYLKNERVMQLAIAIRLESESK